MEKGIDSISPKDYTIVGEYSEGLALASMEKLMSVFETAGGKPVYDEKYGYVDEAGKVVIPFIFTHAKPIKNGLAIGFVNAFDLCKDGKTVARNISEDTLVKYQILLKEQLGQRARSSMNPWAGEGWRYGVAFNGYIVVDKQGKRVGRFMGDEIEILDKVIKVTRNATESLYNFSGEHLLSVRDIGEFNEDGYAKVVNSDDRWGLISDEGEIVIPCRYKTLDLYKKNIAEAYEEGMYDKSHKEIAPSAVYHLKTRVRYDYMKEIQYKIYLAKKDGKFGVINSEGEELFPLEYDEIKEYNIDLKNNKFELLGIKKEDNTDYILDVETRTVTALTLSSGVKP